jgi:hypothetical protein
MKRKELSDPKPQSSTQRRLRGTSPIWAALPASKGKTKTNGLPGKKRRYFQWDLTHGEIEVYDRRGKHLGSMDPTTGLMTKPKVPGRRIKIA